MPLRIIFLVTVAIVGSVQSAIACLLTRTDPHALVRDADVIVRVRASALSDAPGPSSTRLGLESLVHLGVLEQLKGEALFAITVAGTLSDRPDVNERPVPYGMVRRGGWHGGCFARNYQHGGEYLVLLKRVDGKLTPYWAPLGATNEQITGERDPWVVWVSDQLESVRRSGAGGGRLASWLVPPPRERVMRCAPAGALLVPPRGRCQP
jgi:hypothetical protein